MTRIPNWSFSGEAGAAFECRLERGATVVSDWAACSDPRALRPLGRARRDLHLLGARDATPRATPVRRPPRTYDLDRSAPAAPSIDSVPASPGNDATPAWSFSGEAGAAFECRLERGATVVSDWAACSDPKSFDLSAEPDGTYDFSVRASDAAGNTGSAASSSYELDTGAPAAPSIDSAPATPGNERDSLVVVLRRGGRGVRVPPGARRDRGVRLGGLLGPRSPTTSRPSPTAPTPSRCARRDAAGNTGPAASSAYDLDTTAPAAPVDRSRRRRRPATAAARLWSFSGEAGATFECRLVRGATVVSDWAACSDPRELRPLGRARRHLHLLRARDRRGGQHRCGGQLGLRARHERSGGAFDRLAPAVPGQRQRAVLVILRRDGRVVRVPPGARRDGGLRLGGLLGPRELTTSPLSPTAATPSRCAPTDAAGNTGPAASSSYDLDTSAPGHAHDRLVAGLARATTSSPAWSFSGEAGAAFECRLERGATVVSDWASCSDPKAYDLSAEPDGNYTFSVRATRRSGQHRPRGQLGLRPRHDRARRAPRSTRRRPRRATTAPRRGPSPARPARRFECRLDARARRWSRTGPPARARRPTTSPRSPTATTPSSCAPPTPPATRAARRAPTTRSTHAIPSVPVDRLDARPRGQRPHPGLGLLGRGGRVLRVPPRARRHGGLRLGGLLGPEELRPLGEPDGTYDFSVRAVTRRPAQRPGQQQLRPRPHRAGRALDRLGAGVARRQRPEPVLVLLRRGGRRFECRCDRGATSSPTGRPARAPRRLDLSGAAGRHVHLRGPRHRRRGQHRAPPPAPTTSSTRAPRPRRRSTPSPPSPGQRRRSRPGPSPARPARRSSAA